MEGHVRNGYTAPVLSYPALSLGAVYKTIHDTSNCRSNFSQQQRKEMVF